MAGETIEIDGHEIKLSNRDKLIFPDDGITKSDLVDYYRRIADIALPHYRDRPLSIQRFPDGIDKQGFFQKNASDYFPAWIERAKLEKEGGTVDYVVVDSAATLVYLADQGMVAPHLGLSRIDRIDCPDRLVIDLDPSDGDFGKVQRAARRIHRLFSSAGITDFVQTTGSRGLHVVVALDRSRTFDDVRKIVRDLCRRLADKYGDEMTVEQRKSKRGDRIYLDTGRNAYGQTAIASYGLRAKPGAPVAIPLDWKEALSSDMTPQKYTVANIFRRMSRKEDPWADIRNHAISVDRLEKLAP